MIEIRVKNDCEAKSDPFAILFIYFIYISLQYSNRGTHGTKQ